jgi:hypothetical protein
MGFDARRIASGGGGGTAACREAAQIDLKIKEARLLSDGMLALHIVPKA